MQITEIGIVIIIASLYGFIFNHKFLYYLNVFFIPFSATAIANVGSGENVSAIQAYMYLGFMNISLLFFKNLNFLKNVNKNEYNIIKYFFLFLIAACFSIVSLQFIEGDFIGNKTGEMDSYRRIYFSSTNILQLLYLIFGFLFSMVIYNHTKMSPKNFNMTLKVFGLSLVFVMFWGFFELYCVKSGLEYPKEIFNNNGNKAAQGTSAILDGNISRMASVAVEASILAQVFVVFIPFLYYDYFSRSYKIFSKKISFILLIIFSLFVFLITSSTGVLSLLILYLFIGYLFIIKKRFKERMMWFTLVLILILILIFGFYFLFKDIVDAAILNKGDSYSGLERTLSVQSAFHNFLDYPVLGVGWGSVTSFDLIVRILSNTGIVGGVCFMFFILKNLGTHFNKKKLSKFYLSQKHINPAVVTSFIVILFNNGISGFTFTFGHIWFVFGLSYITSFRKTN